MVNLTYFFPSVADRVKNIEKMEGKKVLITGASGLIGNHVVSTLVDVGADIFIISHTKRPYFQSKSTKSLDWYEFNNCDLRFDYIFHLAGYGQPVQFSRNKFATIMVNTRRLQELFLSLDTYGTILFASTSEVYSGLGVEATEEEIGNTTPEHPRACYIESKRCGETMIHILNEMGDDEQKGKIARIALAYGPGCRYDDTRVMSDFIRMGLDGKITPRGGLSSVRTYCYVQDTTTMLFNILLNGKSTVYNIGGKSRMALRDLLYTIAEKTDAKIKFPDSDDTEGAPSFVGMATDKYHDEFPDMQFTDFDTGLEKTIAWFKYLKETE